jgi:hypothetical protein
VTPESAPGSVTIFAVFALAALAASVLIGGLLRQLWAQYEKRTIEKKWQERERLLDSRGPVAPSHEIFGVYSVLLGQVGGPGPVWVRELARHLGPERPGHGSGRPGRGS